MPQSARSAPGIAAAGQRLARRLATYVAAVAAVAGGIDEVDETHLRVVGRQRCGTLGLGGVRERAGGPLGGPQLTDGLCHVHLSAAGFRHGGGGDQDALRRPQRQPAVGSQLEAASAPGATTRAGRMLVDKVAKTELRFAITAGEPRPHLSRRIIDKPLVVAGAQIVACPPESTPG